MLLARKDIDINITDKKGVKLTDYQRIKQCTQSDKLLLSHPDVQINKHDTMGCTLLHQATVRGNVSLVEFLLTLPNIDTVNIGYNEH